MNTATQNLVSQSVESQFFNDAQMFYNQTGPLQGMRVLAHVQSLSSAELKNKIESMVGTNFDVKVQQTLVSDAFEVTVKIKEYCKVNGGMFYKTATYILNQMLENGIKFTNTKNLY